MKKETYHSLGPAGLNLIKTFEQCRLRVYLRPANRMAIGYGHVLLPRFDHVLFKNMSYDQLNHLVDECQKLKRMTREAAQALTISPAQADALLIKDTYGLTSYLNSVTPVELTKNQFDALCSLIFNIGQGNYAGSTLRKKLYDEDFKGAAAEFDRWAYATVNGKKTKLNGLVTRRAAERALFEANTQDAPALD